MPERQFVLPPFPQIQKWATCVFGFENSYALTKQHHQYHVRRQGKRNELSISRCRCLTVLFKCQMVPVLSSVKMSCSHIIPFHLRRVVSCVLHPCKLSILFQWGDTLKMKAGTFTWFCIAQGTMQRTATKLDTFAVAVMLRNTYLCTLL